MTFADTRVNSLDGPQTVTVTNPNFPNGNLTMTGFAASGSNPDAFFYDEDSSCFTTALAPGQSCTVDFFFNPDKVSGLSATFTLQSSAAVAPTVRLAGRGTDGYIIATASGDSFSYGDSPRLGYLDHLNKPIVGIAPTPSGDGAWRVATDGGIFADGDADFYGSAGNIRLNQPIVGMAPTATSEGYWLVASDGGIFAYGDAQFYGSTGSIKLNKPIVGMAPTASGEGYWLVASDGGIFAFGDAQFYGSAGSLSLNKPIVGMATTYSGNGYWMVATDGGIFSYGDAQFYGSTGSIKLNRPIVGMSPTPTGKGYRLVASDGGVFAYADANFYGSAGNEDVEDVIGISPSANFY